MSNDATLVIGADVNRALSGINRINRSLGAIKLDAITNLAAKALNAGTAFIEASTKINRVKKVLANVEGSAPGGEVAFERMDKMAQTTQFTVDQLSEKYVQLRAAGIEPTEKLMRTMADTAAATNDDLGTMAAMTDLITRTTAGGLGLEELNRLADRGLPVWKILNEEMGLSRLEVSEFGKSAEGANQIVNTLFESLGESNFDLAATKAADASTAMQNLGSAWDQFYAAIMDAGLEDIMVDLINSVIDWVNTFRKMIPYIKIEWAKMTGFFDYSIEKIQYGFVQFVNYSRLVWAMFVDLMVDGWNSIVESSLGSMNEMIRAYNQLDWVPGTFEEIAYQVAEVGKNTQLVNADIEAAAAYHEKETQAILAKTNARVRDLQTAQQAAVTEKEIERQRQEQRAARASAGPMIQPQTTGTTGTGYSQEGEDATGPLDAYTEYYDGLKDKLSDYIGYEQAEIEKSTQWRLSKLEELKRASLISEDELQSAKDKMMQDGVKDTIGALGEGLNALGQHNEKAFKMAKAFNIAQALMNTYNSAAAAFAAMAPIPFVGPALGIAAAAAAIMSGMAQVAAIRSQTFQGRMYGGGVTGGQTYMVGERGPELFTPGAGGGSITPNGELGGKTVNVNFSIQAVDSKGVDDLLLTRKPMIVSMVRQAVNEQPGILG